MIEHKPLVLGCDDHRLLSVILEKLGLEMDLNYILATRPSDLFRIIKSSNPALVIVSFRNNQQVIDRVCGLAKDTKIPILCLVNKHERDTLKWSEQDIVFTHKIDQSNKAGDLSTRIKSLLLLIKNSKQPKCYQNRDSKRKTLMSNNGDLARYVMELDQKNRSLEKIKKKIKQLYHDIDGPVKKSLVAIVNSIQTSKTNSRFWKDFKMYFDDINPTFIKQLTHFHPGLTSMDIKYCCFLKLNMSTDEIRYIIGISQESVRTHKYRLKKKLELNKDQDLSSYIISFPKKEVFAHV